MNTRFLTFGALAAWTLACSPRRVEAQSCWDCLSCFLGQHRLDEGEVDAGYYSYHSECWSPSSCDGYHPPCTIGGAPTSARLQQLADLLGRADAEWVVEVMETYRDFAKLNLRRRALQIMGCTGEIIAHIPLPSNLALTSLVTLPLERGRSGVSGDRHNN